MGMNGVSVSSRIAMPEVSSSVVASSRQFRGFKPETERQIRQVDIKANPVIEQLTRAWKRGGISSDPMYYPNDYYNLADDLSRIGYSSKDVESFSLVLGDFTSRKDFPAYAGLFLCALINNCPDKKFIIHTTHLPVAIDMFAYRNTKDITVDGSLGGNCGYMMEMGSLHVRGDVGYDIGSNMIGGSIVIEGNAGDGPGYQMRGGIHHPVSDLIIQPKICTILVKGDCGVFAGMEMKGGSLTIKGKAEGFIAHDMVGGELHVDGRLPKISKSYRSGEIFFREHLIACK